jgi:NADPH:quinone reductase-like Zn-dependent oxidoreductase
VQLAKHLGARVVGVTSTNNVACVRGLGADEVIDYTRADALAGDALYDVILDTVGDASYARCRRALRPAGRLMLCAAGLGQIVTAGWVTRGTAQRVRAGAAPERTEDLRYLAQLTEAGAYRPLIDRHYPLSQIVEAHAYVDAGHKRGSVVIAVQQSQLPSDAPT